MVIRGGARALTTRVEYVKAACSIKTVSLCKTPVVVRAIAQPPSLSPLHRRRLKIRNCQG